MALEFRRGKLLAIAMDRTRASDHPACADTRPA